MSRSSISHPPLKLIPLYNTHFFGNVYPDQRSGQGEERWESEFNQIYTGTFFQDSIHFKGTYFWEEIGTTYEGRFYANKLEGYGSIKYGDGSQFEGLFKDNKRFGPGVFTHITNCNQDVGLWNGRSLVRLRTMVDKACVPQIVYSKENKTELLKYRIRVSVCKHSVDNVLCDLEIDKEVLKLFGELCNRFVRNPHSSFFSKELHDELYFEHIDIPSTQREAEDYYTNLENNKLPQAEGSYFCFVEKQCRIDTLTLETIDKLVDEIREGMKVMNAELQTTDKPDHGFKRSTLGGGVFLSKERRRTHVGFGEERELIRRMTMQIAAIRSPSCITHRGRESLREIPANVAETELEQRRGLVEQLDLENAQPALGINVTEVLAWNNEAISIEMLQHIFLHQRFEDEISYSVENLLLGEREQFLPPGDHEQSCIAFLYSCYVGNLQKLWQLVTEHHIDADLADSKGNTGVMYAAASDQVKVIGTLINFGCNINSVNDECVTPLVMCILRYIVIHNNASNWEVAFVRRSVVNEHEVPELMKWRQQYSTINAENDRVAQTSLTQQPYLLSTCFIKPPQLKTSKIKSNESRIGKASAPKKKAASTNRRQKEKESGEALKTPKIKVIDPRLNSIYETIITLLECGANPNVGFFPMPTLILTVFTKNVQLLKTLLSSGSNPDVATAEENLTALHTLTSLPYCKEHAEMLSLLLQHSANPNLATAACHWIEQKNEILANHTVADEDLGKTPLHILSMRCDFRLDEHNLLSPMAQNLIAHGADCNKLYLGHSPLSLAVLRGNLKLIKTLLAAEETCPEKPLGGNMGSPLTVLLLKRYQGVLPVETVKQVLDLLTECGINPLNPIEGFANAVEFVHKEHEAVKDERGQSGKTKSIKSLSGRSKNNSQSTKSSASKKKSGKLKQVEQIRAHLNELTKEVILQHAQGKALAALLEFVEENDYGDRISENLAKMLSPNSIARILKIMTNANKIEIAGNYYNSITTLIKFVENLSTLSGKRSPRNSFSVDKILSEMEQVETFSSAKLVHPEIDTQEDKYVACFNCNLKSGLLLLLCPGCELIYFCSEKCNKQSNRKKTHHKCNLSFYNQEKVRYNQAISSESQWIAPNSLSSKLQAIWENKRTERLERDKKEREQKLFMRYASLKGLLFKGKPEQSQTAAQRSKPAKQKRNKLPTKCTACGKTECPKSCLLGKPGQRTEVEDEGEGKATFEVSHHREDASTSTMSTAEAETVPGSKFGSSTFQGRRDKPAAEKYFGAKGPDHAMGSSKQETFGIEETRSKKTKGSDLARTSTREAETVSDKAKNKFGGSTFQGRRDKPAAKKYFGGKEPGDSDPTRTSTTDAETVSGKAPNTGSKFGSSTFQDSRVKSDAQNVFDAKGPGHTRGSSKKEQIMMEETRSNKKTKGNDPTVTSTTEAETVPGKAANTKSKLGSSKFQTRRVKSADEKPLCEKRPMVVKPSTAISLSSNSAKRRFRPNTSKIQQSGKQTGKGFVCESVDPDTSVKWDRQMVIRRIRNMNTICQLAPENHGLIERLAECFPDTDLCRMFLPCACFGDGQLYYCFNRMLCASPCNTYSGI